MPVNVPNIITIARMLLVPLTVWLILSEAYGSAFTAFLLAGLSDAIDGVIARRFNLMSELGSYLDPLADKALLVSIYVSLGALHFLPVWLAILVVTRDILIVGAVLLALLMDRPIAMKPLWISKVNTTAQIAFAGALLAALAMQFDLGVLHVVGIGVVAALTFVSGAIYMRDWVGHMMAPASKGQIK